MRPTVFAPSPRRAHARLTTAIVLACPPGAAGQDVAQRAQQDAPRRAETTSDYRIVHLATAHGLARVRRHRRTTYGSTYGTLAPRS